MDIQKSKQALKTVMNICDVNIMNDKKRYCSIIDDVLCGPDYTAERMILKRAVESYAMPVLLGASKITADMAGRAVEQLKEESRMTQEDAEFTVQCIIAAHGGNPDTVACNKNQCAAQKQDKIKNTSFESALRRETTGDKEQKHNEERKAKENSSVHDENAQTANDSIQINTDMFFRACKISIDSLSCEIGYPINASSKGFQKAKNSFKIPYNEAIYFIYDATLLSNCKKGFAICTSGIYGFIKKNIYISWAEFIKRGVYVEDDGKIAVGDERLAVNSGDRKIIEQILRSIRMEFQVG